MSLSWDEITLGPDAYSSYGRQHVSPPVWTRIYRVRGREAHLAEATCAVQSRHRDYDGWRGTGTQDEWEHAAALPLCWECFAYREAYVDDERLGTGHGREMT